MLETLGAWDEKLLFLINGANAPWLDVVMVILSAKLTFLVYIPIVFVIYQRSNLRSAGITLLGALITFALDDAISTRFFKNNFERLRPCHQPSLEGLLHLPDGCGGQFGFISSHAANHFGLAIFFALVFSRYFPKSFWWFLPFPLLVIYSRVYLAAHYPGDVICGGILGAIVAFATYRVFQKWLV